MRLIFPVVVVSLTAHLSPAEVFRLAHRPSAHLRRQADRRPPGHRRVRRHLPADDLPGLHARHREGRSTGSPRSRSSSARSVGWMSCPRSSPWSRCWLSLKPPPLPTRRSRCSPPESPVLRPISLCAASETSSKSRASARRTTRTRRSRRTPTTLSGKRLAVGRAAFFLFLYLELIDASFSFDGVVGAFAISQQIFVIAAGSRYRRQLHPVADRLPGPQGHAAGVHLPRTRRALGDRCAWRCCSPSASRSTCPRWSPG